MARRMTPMEPGERNRQVLIEQIVESAGASSFPVENWGDLGWVYMAKFDLGGNERFQADQLSSRYDTRWEMGYRSDMDPELIDVAKVRRLVYQDRIYEIVTASHIGMREGVEILTIARLG